MRRPVIILLIILFFIIDAFCITVIFKTHNRVNVELIGDSTINSTYGKDFNDQGFKVLLNNEELINEDIEYDIISDVDSTKIGEYTIKYHIKYNNKEYDLERKVNIVDDEVPIIETNLEEVTMGYCNNELTSTLEYKATDNFDGDISSKVEKKETDDKYILSVTDSNGNTTTKELKKKIGEKPDDKIVLNGKSTVYVLLGSNYNEEGAYLTDGCGNTIEGEINTAGKVDTNKEGKYTITYTAKNNDKIKKTRTVSVYKNNPNTDKNTGDKTIYLTFDDGPCAYTQQVLDILRKYNVKATFFVTNQFPNYAYMIKKEADEGHAVAVHSYTHNWNIYDSVDNYIRDFNKMNDVIEQQTGKRSKIFRFPGGSSNTISKGHSKGVVSAIAAKMTSDGYQYFDWNVSSGDAESNPTGEKIYNNVINGVSGSCTNCVVLMHDIKKLTVGQLDRILATLTSRGYKFGTLDTTSATCHHRIAN